MNLKCTFSTFQGILSGESETFNFISSHNHLSTDSFAQYGNTLKSRAQVSESMTAKTGNLDEVKKLGSEGALGGQVLAWHFSGKLWLLKHEVCTCLEQREE